MRKIAIFVLFFAICCASVYAERNLYEVFKGKDVIKVYLKEVKDDTGDSLVNENLFSEVFEDVIKKRINIKFEPVKSPDQADVIIEADIHKFDYKEKVHPRFYSAYALVADATAPKSSARIVVDYTVKIPGGREYKFKRFTTEERQPREGLDKDGALKGAIIKNVNRFIYRAFYKQRKRR